MAPTAATPARWPTLVQSYVDAGDLDAAQRYLEGVLAKDPASVPGRLLLAGLDQRRGDPAAAEAGYRAVVADGPCPAAGASGALLPSSPARAGCAEAAAALDAGLAAAPDSTALVFARAGLLEKKGDIDGAIAAYEALYAKDSGSPVLANNLASLIASYRDDPASLERAFAIARRLRGTDVPYFQDTYGWILHRRGDSDEALELSRPRRQRAARQRAGAVPPRRDRAGARPARRGARELRQRAVAAAEAGSPLPQLDAVRERLAEIDAAPATDGGPAPAPAPPAPAAAGDQGLALRLAFGEAADPGEEGLGRGGGEPGLGAARRQRLGDAGGESRLGVGDMDAGAGAQPAGGVDLVVVGMLALRGPARQEHDRLAVLAGGDHRAHAGMGDHELGLGHRPGVVLGGEAAHPAHVPGS